MVAAVTRTLALLAAAIALVAAPASARAAGGRADPAALERAGVQNIVVERRPGLDSDDRAALRADAGVRLEQTLTLPDTEVVRAAPGELTEALDALNADPGVVYAEPDAPVHATATDARFGEQWALRNTGQRVLGQTGLADADIDAPEAWSLGASGLGVTVAVVDTGIALTHPELAGRIATNPGETGGGKETNHVDDDHDGYVDDWQGWDWVAGDNVPADENGHGTHVSGTIAAPQDAAGVAGVAPDARILPLRVLDASGSGCGSAVASAFDLAGRLGIPVVNASLGSSGLSTAQRTAINAHPNTLYVIAAGNDGHNNDTTPTYPCAIPAANIVCVGATDNRDARASFSNVGATSVDLFAPGVGILSTYGAGYGSMSGTSMATPHVAGALALMRQAAPTLNAAQLKQGVLDGADRVPALSGLSVTGARLNAANAIQDVRAVAGLPPLVATDPIPFDPAPASTPAPARASGAGGQRSRHGAGGADPGAAAPHGAPPLRPRRRAGNRHRLPSGRLRLPHACRAAALPRRPGRNRDRAGAAALVRTTGAARIARPRPSPSAPSRAPTGSPSARAGRRRASPPAPTACGSSPRTPPGARRRSRTRSRSSAGSARDVGGERRLRVAPVAHRSRLTGAVPALGDGAVRGDPVEPAQEHLDVDGAAVARPLARVRGGSLRAARAVARAARRQQVGRTVAPAARAGQEVLDRAVARPRRDRAPHAALAVALPDVVDCRHDPPTPNVATEPRRDDAACVAFLQWALPRLGLRWAGYRKVRRQVCRRLHRRLAELGLPDLDAYRARLAADPGRVGRARDAHAGDDLALRARPGRCSTRSRARSCRRSGARGCERGAPGARRARRRTRSRSSGRRWTSSRPTSTRPCSSGRGARPTRARACASSRPRSASARS